jgi:hypothetical protein
MLVLGCTAPKQSLYSRYLTEGRLDLAEAQADTTYAAHYSEHRSSSLPAFQRDSIAGIQFYYDADRYRGCMAFAKHEAAADRARQLLANSLGKNDPYYLDAVMECAYARLLQGRREEGLELAKEVKTKLLADPTLGRDRVGLSDLFTFYMQAQDEATVKEVVRRGLAYYNPAYRTVPDTEGKALLGAPELGAFDRVTDLGAYSRFLNHAALYNWTVLDPFWCEHFYKFDRAFAKWYSSTVRDENVADIAYAHAIAGLGKSSAALELDKRAYLALGKRYKASNVDYAIGATNYASHYLDYATNNCVAMPYAYLDSIYSVDCPKMNGRTNEERMRYIQCSCGQALLRTSAGEPDSALSTLRKAEVAYHLMGMRGRTPESYGGMYAAYTATWFEYWLSTGHYQRCDSLLNVAERIPLTWRIMRPKLAYMRGKLQLAQGDPEAAARTLASHRTVTNTYRNEGLAAFSSRNTRDLLGAYESADALELTALLALPGKEQQLLSILDSRKLKVASAQIQAAHDKRMGFTDEVYDEAYADWHRTKKEIGRIMTDRSATASMLQRARSLEDTLSAQEALLSLLYREWMKDVRDQPGYVDRFTVEAALNPKTAVIDAHRVHLFDAGLTAYEPAYLLMVRRNTGVPTVIRVNDAERIDSLIAVVNERHTQGKDAPEAIQALSDALVAPLSAALGKTSLVYVCGDGALGLLNWSYLWEGSKRFCEDRSIQHVHGMHALRYKEVTGYFDYVREAAFFGAPTYYSSNASREANVTNAARISTAQGEVREFTGKDGVKALPHTQPEIEASARIVKDAPLVAMNERAVKTFLGVDATEANVRSLGKVNLLHIATHGFFEQNEDELMSMYRLNDSLSSFSRDPLLRSGLLLAGSGDYLANGTRSAALDDGLLSAAEIADMDLSKTELVVLSACQSGQGTVATSDGIDGLQSALFIAGAKAVMVSYWKVDDKFTTMFMQEFYRRWSGKERHAFEALRSTQRHFAAMPEYASPRYWASFNIVAR